MNSCASQINMKNSVTPRSTVFLSVLVILSCYLFNGAVSTTCFQSLAKNAGYYVDCKAAFDLGERCSGVYTIKPDKLPPFEVYCDMETDGGGWTVFQRRMDGTQDFPTSANNYINGFGDMNREFWLSLNNIHRLTMLSGINTTLRVDLDDFEGNTRFAKYSVFRVLNAAEGYQLIVTGYSGDAGDSLSSSNGQPFLSDLSRYSSQRQSWWQNASLSFDQLPALVRRNESQHFANLNGRIYYRSGIYTERFSSTLYGVYWSSWRGLFYSLKFTEMKLRRENSAHCVLSSAIFLFISMSISFCCIQ